MNTRAKIRSCYRTQRSAKNSPVSTSPTRVESTATFVEKDNGCIDDAEILSFGKMRKYLGCFVLLLAEIINFNKTKT